MSKMNDPRVHGVIATQQSQDSNIGLQHVIDAIPRFTVVKDYTTFTVEYAFQESDIILHFFLPEDFQGAAGVYWERTFPTALDIVARDYFNAEAPRLQAKYTSELKSWWFRARGYDHLLDLVGFLQGFFDRLDAALEVRG